MSVQVSGLQRKLLTEKSSEISISLVLVFPHECLEEIGTDGFSRLVDAIRSFYDSNRQRWMGHIEDLSSPGLPPRDAVIPNIVVEIAQPRSMIH